MKLAAVIILFATPAFAQPVVELAPTCVELAPNDPIAEGRMLLVRALEKQEYLIVETGCTQTIVLSHEIAGPDVIVRIENGSAKRKLTVAKTADMLDVYGRMVTSLFEPPPPPVVESEPTPPTTTWAPTLAPTPVHVDEVPSEVPEVAKKYYARMGVGAIGNASGAAVIFGYRYSSDVFAFDFSFALITADDAGASASQVAARAQLLKIRKPHDSTSSYYGGGLSLGSTTLQANDEMSYSGSGLQLEATLGWEFSRTNTMRFYLEGNLSKPIYDIDDATAFVASFGAGW